MRLGQKVYDYRKDILSKEDARNLDSVNAGLKKARLKSLFLDLNLKKKPKKGYSTSRNQEILLP